MVLAQALGCIVSAHSGRVKYEKVTGNFGNFLPYEIRFLDYRDFFRPYSHRMDPLFKWLSFTPILLVVAAYAWRYQRKQRISSNTRREAIETGLAEPASLHPIIDRNKCIGCRSCIYACPQQLGHRVLGIYHNKAELLEPANPT